MFSYQVQIYEKQNGTWAWRNLSGWTRPFTDGTRLDETLDSGTLNLSCVKREKAIKPFTRLRFIVRENGTEKERIYRLVASARKTKRRYSGTPLYDWTINTIELTKLLERRLIDTMTVTKYLSTNYTRVQTSAIFKSGKKLEDIEGDTNRAVGIFDIPFGTNDAITIPATSTMFLLPSDRTSIISGSARYSWAECTTNIKNENGDIIASQTGNYGAPTFPHQFIKAGIYQIEYVLKILGIYTAGTDITNRYFNAIYVYNVSVSNDSVLITQPTISSVCNRLLSAGVTRRKNIETQEFLLDPTFEAEYASVPSPEFSFTNCTLFEALLQVGGYMHGIPRLIPRSTSDDTHYYVTFDKLGGNEQAPMAIRTEGFRDRGEYQPNTDYYQGDKVTYLGKTYYYHSIYNSANILPTDKTVWVRQTPYIFTESTIDVNDWCGQIDSPSQNLVNTEDVNAGSITELGNSFITVRTEEGQVEINADDVLVRVSKPIQQILKVECMIGSTNTAVGDITPYVYESAEYQTLSSYWGSVYPYSKGWAIYYTQGGNTIEGLTFRIIPPTDSGIDVLQFKNYAIVNIINEKTGSSLGVVDGEFMRKLAFRVTYVPIAQARVKAHKPSLAEGGTVNNALTYNQSANIAETSYYGEKMRGAIARLGHDVETRTYDVFHYDQLPKVGQLLDGKYIAHIDYEWDITKVRITLALTKDFNMLSQFVGLNSNYRLYDISEKQSVERNVNYDEFVVLSKTRPNVDMGRYMMLKDVAANLYYELHGTASGATTPNKISVARLTPHDSNGNEIPNRRVILPAVAFPFGTSLGFNVQLFDNYGAGYQQSDAYGSSSNYAVQRLVPYTDSFGEIAQLKLSFDNTTGWSQSSANDYGDGSPAMLYPQATTEDTATGAITTGDNYLILQKDSREKINFTYQLHFVSADPNIVIGSGLAKYNPLVKNFGTLGKTVRLITKKKTINALNRFIKIEDGDVVERIFPTLNDESGTIFTLLGIGPISDYANVHSYAYCVEVQVGDETKYELLFGENFPNGMQKSTIDGIYFAGAIPQACNQDKPSCLQFAPKGATYYRQGTLFGWIAVGELEEDVLIDPTKYSSYNNSYYEVDVGGTTYFVPKSSFVTAYNFE